MREQANHVTYRHFHTRNVAGDARLLVTDSLTHSHRVQSLSISGVCLSQGLNYCSLSACDRNYLETIEARD